MADYGTKPSDPAAKMGDVEAAVAAGMNMAGPLEADGVHYTLLPKDCKVERFDGEHLLTNPRRMRGLVTASDAESFLTYFNRFKDSASMIFANPDNAALKFVGVLNYHTPAGGSGEAVTGELPRWGDHRVIYACPYSKEWLTWTKNDKQKQAQVPFAQFIEDNLDDIVAPAGATMLEIAKTFQAKKNANFSSDIRLDNGQVQLTYVEEIRGAATQGQTEIPEKFELGIPVFYGGQKYRVLARLRYRIEAGHLELWYSLVKPEKMVDDAFNTTFDEIETETGAPIIKGMPPGTPA